MAKEQYEELRAAKKRNALDHIRLRTLSDELDDIKINDVRESTPPKQINTSFISDEDEPKENDLLNEYEGINCML